MFVLKIRFNDRYVFFFYLSLSICTLSLRFLLLNMFPIFIKLLHCITKFVLLLHKDFSSIDDVYLSFCTLLNPLRRRSTNLHVSPIQSISHTSRCILQTPPFYIGIQHNTSSIQIICNLLGIIIFDVVKYYFTFICNYITTVFFKAVP